MLLLERFRVWRERRRVDKRKQTFHTMEAHSIERAIVGLSLMHGSSLSTRGKVLLTRPHLKNINDALNFHVIEMERMVSLLSRPRELPKELKEIPNEAEVVWLDKFFLYHYSDVDKGIDETINILNRALMARNDLSKGYVERFDYRIRKILKQLDIVVEHYTQLL